MRYSIVVMFVADVLDRDLEDSEELRLDSYSLLFAVPQQVVRFDPLGIDLRTLIMIYEVPTKQEISLRRIAVLFRTVGQAGYSD